MEQDKAKRMMKIIWTSMQCLNLPINQNDWSRFTFCIIIGNVILLQMAHFTYMIKNVRDVVKMAMTCTTVSTAFQGCFKLMSFYWNSSNMKQMYRTVAHDFWPISITASNPKYRALVTKLVKRYSYLMLSYYSVIYTTSFLLLIAPLYLGRRELPFASYYPFDALNSPVYEMLYVWQWFGHFYGIALTACSYDCVFIAITSNLIVQFKLLQYALRQIGTVHETEMCKLIKNSVQHQKTLHAQSDEKLMVLCVKHHNKLLKFADQIETTFSPIICFQYVASVSGLCVGIFLLNLVDGMNLLKLMFFVFGHLAQLFYYCLMGQAVIDESMNTANGAFNSNWRNVRNSVKKALILIIQRAQRCKKITALGVADLNLANFIGVLRISFSFFTLLRNLIEKQTANL